MESSSIDKVTSNLFVRTFLTFLGIVAAVITIYAFFQENKADLQYEILANTNVLDINAEVSKLDILYDSTSLNQTNQNLRIITLKVINKGGQDILISHFDNNAPIGLNVNNGRIIEKPELINTSNQYLSNNLDIIYNDPKSIKFSSVIIESEEYFTIKLLVLHDSNENPEITSNGKIAGQQRIAIVNSTETVKNTPFLAETFRGSIWVQTVRLISYFIAIVLIIIIIAYTGDKISSYKTDRRRTKRINEFKSSEDYQYSRMDDAIFHRYKISGTYSFERMLSLTENEEELNDIYQKLINDLKDKKSAEHEIYFKDNIRILNRRDDWSIINNMIKDGILIKQGDKLTVNQPMRESLKKLVKFLKEKNEFDNDRFYQTTRVRTHETKVRLERDLD